jgi:multicomponent Na+:H+ antiporter subunit F
LNEWQIAAAGLLAALVPCAWVIARRGFVDALVALNLAGTLAAVALLVLSEAQDRESFADLAIALATTSLAGTLLFARYLERSGDPGEGGGEEERT